MKGELHPIKHSLCGGRSFAWMTALNWLRAGGAVGGTDAIYSLRAFVYLGSARCCGMVRPPTYHIYLKSTRTSV